MFYWQRKFNLRREIQNWMFKWSIRIFQGLIEFIEGLIARKIIFLVNLGFNWKKLKSGVKLKFLRVNLVKWRA